MPSPKAPVWRKSAFISHPAVFADFFQKSTIAVVAHRAHPSTVTELFTKIKCQHSLKYSAIYAQKCQNHAIIFTMSEFDFSEFLYHVEQF